MQAVEHALRLALQRAIGAGQHFLEQVARAFVAAGWTRALPGGVKADARSFVALADRHGIALVGGDTTRGPLSLPAAAMGLVEAGCALRRDMAQIGDDVWVTGTLGDAAMALEAVLQAREVSPAMRERLDRPAPRVAVGQRLSGLVHACINVSDGVLADLGHVCERSGVGAEIHMSDLPCSIELAAMRAPQRWPLQTSGDDYELCFTAPRRNRDQIVQALDFTEVAATRIGRILAGQGVIALDEEGSPWQPPSSGYTHFM